jgi:hypothetical protein
VRKFSRELVEAGADTPEVLEFVKEALDKVSLSVDAAIDGALLDPPGRRTVVTSRYSNLSVRSPKAAAVPSSINLQRPLWGAFLRNSQAAANPYATAA